jgi:hypothetical protein
MFQVIVGEVGVDTLQAFKLSRSRILSPGMRFEHVGTDANFCGDL